MRMNNRWNRFIYRVWAPVYDALLEHLFGWGRRRAMEVAAPTGGDRLCFVGIGTGTDLLLLPSGVEAVGIDLSEAMLARAREKLPIPGCEVTLLVGDAEALPFDDTDGPLDIVTGAPCRIVHDEPSVLGGMYRVVVLEKRGDGPERRMSP